MSKELRAGITRWAEVGLVIVFLVAVALMRYVWRVGNMPLYPSIALLVAVVVLGSLLQYGRQKEVPAGTAKKA